MFQWAKSQSLVESSWIHSCWVRLVMVKLFNLSRKWKVMLWVGGFHNVLWAKFPILLLVKSVCFRVGRDKHVLMKSLHIMSCHIISYHIIMNQIKCKFACPTCFLNIRWFHQIKAIAIKFTIKITIKITIKSPYSVGAWHHEITIFPQHPMKSPCENPMKITMKITMKPPRFPRCSPAFSTYRWQDEESDSGSDGERRRVRRERKARPGWRGW